MPAQIRFGEERLAVELLEFRRPYFNIGFDAGGLDGAAIRCVIARGSHLDGVGLIQRNDRLDAALAKGLCAHHHSALMVLKRAGEDF